MRFVFGLTDIEKGRSLISMSVVCLGILENENLANVINNVNDIDKKNKDNTIKYKNIVLFLYIIDCIVMIM
jgi:hypothetical protein